MYGSEGLKDSMRDLERKARDFPIKSSSQEGGLIYMQGQRVFALKFRFLFARVFFE